MSLTRGVVVALGLVGIVLVAMLGTLVGVLISLENSRTEIRGTRVTLAEVDRRVDAVTRDVDPLLRAAMPLTEADTRRGLRRTTRSVADAAARVPGLADSATEAVAIAAAIIEVLDRAGLADTVPALRDLPDTVREMRDLVAAQKTLTARSVRIQLRTLGVNRETQRLLGESLGVQRETLTRVRAIDGKLPELKPGGAPAGDNVQGATPAG